MESLLLVARGSNLISETWKESLLVQYQYGTKIYLNTLMVAFLKLFKIWLKSPYPQGPIAHGIGTFGPRLLQVISWQQLQKAMKVVIYNKKWNVCLFTEKNKKDSLHFFNKEQKNEMQWKTQQRIFILLIRHGRWRILHDCLRLLHTIMRQRLACHAW